MRTKNGFSLIEVMVAIGVLSIITYAFSSFLGGSLNRQKYLEHKSATFDIEQGIRTVFINPAVCKCNFNGIGPTISAGVLGSTVPVSKIAFYTDSACTAASAKNVAISGAAVPGRNDMTINSMQLSSFTVLPGNTAAADLDIVYQTGGAGTPLKNGKVSSLFFKTVIPSPGAAPVITDCLSMGVAPSSCGYGKVCWNGHQFTFTNSTGNPISAEIQGSDSTGFTAVFRTPAGRSTLLSLVDDGTNMGIMNATPATGWHAQFCYSHPAPPCGVQTVFGILQYNCGSAIYWKVDSNPTAFSSGADQVCP